MKKWIIVGTALSLAFALNACGGKSSETDKMQDQEREFSEEQDEERESDESEFPEEPEEAKEAQQEEGASAAVGESLPTGTWDADDVRVSLVIQEDGRFTLADEEKAVSGIWRVEGENMILVVDEADADKYGMDETEREEIHTYHMEGDTLSMKIDDGEWIFKKVEKASYIPAGE